MGKSDPTNKDVYKQQSVILVSSDTPGVKIRRMMSVMGFDDAPHGHGHITFDNVRVHESNMVLGPGRGFEIIQGRLGPGRIHHAMRAIGVAERALEWLIMRANDPSKKPFKKNLSEHGTIIEAIARSTMCLTVLDRAMQAFGGAGLSQDTPLAYMWANARTLRIVDGPDEVHIQQMGRNENKRHVEATKKIKMQKAKTLELFKQHGFPTEGTFIGDDMMKSML
jgi:acyl-CoA dehydrogenase